LGISDFGFKEFYQFLKNETMYPGSYPFKRFNPKSAIPDPKSRESQIPNRKTRNLIEFYHYPFQHPKTLILDNHLISKRFILAVRKILTTKSEIIQLTSYLLLNKLSCYLKLDGPFSSGPNRYLKRRSCRLTAVHTATFSALHLIFREVCFVWKPPFKTIALR